MLFVLVLSVHGSNIKDFARICLDVAKSPCVFKQYDEQEESIF